MKLIPVSNGRAFAIVDDTDYEALSEYRWSLAGHKARYAAGTSRYAARASRSGSSRKTLYMHRLVMNAPSGVNVDHANGNPLDNRRQNLRFCNQSQNNANGRMGRGTTSRYRGVFWDKARNRWRVSIQVRGRNNNIGRFTDETEAAKRYDVAAREAFGEFATLNFPELSQ